MWSQVRSGPSGTTDESEAGSRPSKAIHSENLGPQRSSQGPENTLTICAAFTSCSLRSISNSKTAELQKLSTAQVAGTGLLGNQENNKKKTCKFSNLTSTQSWTNSPMIGLEEGLLAH